MILSDKEPTLETLDFTTRFDTVQQPWDNNCHAHIQSVQSNMGPERSNYHKGSGHLHYC